MKIPNPIGGMPGDGQAGAWPKNLRCPLPHTALVSSGCLETVSDPPSLELLIQPVTTGNRRLLGMKELRCGLILLEYYLAPSTVWATGAHMWSPEGAVSSVSLFTTSASRLAYGRGSLCVC